MRRFPPPWTVEALDGGFKVVDATVGAHLAKQNVGPALDSLADRTA